MFRRVARSWSVRPRTQINQSHLIQNNAAVGISFGSAIVSFAYLRFYLVMQNRLNRTLFGNEAMANHLPHYVILYIKFQPERREN